MTRKQKQLGAVGGLLLVAWLALFLSNHAVLVWSSTDETAIGAKLLNCHYFTGTGIESREHLKLKGIGREYCARWISLA